MELEGQIERLRSLAQDCIAKHMLASAVFFADKLVTLTRYGPGDVFLLAQAYYLDGQYRRALMLLRMHGLMEDGRFRYLAAKCLAEVAEWEEVLQLLGDGLEDMEEPSCDHTSGYDISMRAAMCLLRGNAHAALGGRAAAVRWYRDALAADAFCYEALAALVEGHMLSSAEEVELVGSLGVAARDGWLPRLYRCKGKKYAQQDEVEEMLRELETPFGNAAVQQAAGASTSAPGTLGTSAGSSGSGLDATPLSCQQQQAGREGQHHAQQEQGGGASSSGRGWGLGDNASVLSCRADWLLHQGRYEDVYRLTSVLVQRDPYALEVLPHHLAAALQLGHKNELFLRGHKLVEEYPSSAMSWYAVGVYYMAVRQYESARRHFGKATQLDRGCASAWVAFGHAFAAQDESDQALAAYRSAARLFPGLHQPLVGMGMEYSRMGNTHLAGRALATAQALCPLDPLACHELGVLAYRNGRYDEGVRWLRRALSLVPGKLLAVHEATLFNLGHSLRKLGDLAGALEAYQTALSIIPTQASTWAAIGFVQQLMGDAAAAAASYHSALALRPDEPFAALMLGEALRDECVGRAASGGGGRGEQLGDEMLDEGM